MSNRIGTNGVLNHEVKASRKRPRKAAETVLVVTDSPTGVEVEPGRIVTRRPTKADLEAKTKAESELAKQARIKLKLARAIGAIGVGLIGLSVVHCKEAIVILTHAHVALAYLLAIAIDAGMVACKVCSVLVKDEELHEWADLYVKLAIVLSILLNIIAFVVDGNVGANLPPLVSGYVVPIGAVASQIALGVCIPVLAYMLSRVVGPLFK